MNETRPVAETGSVPVEPRRSRAVLIWLLLPLAVLAFAIAWLVTANPLSRFDNGAPPVENLTFERTVLSDGGIDLLVRAGGSEPMTIAQVQVDDAYWQFVQEPARALGRGDTAWIRLSYPWVLGEAHAVKIITNTGATFEHEIAVAVPTPVANAATLWSQMLLGALVGIVPVAIGLMFYPALRGIGRGGMNFLLAMTVGLLVFLMIDAAGEAFELAGEAAAIFQGQAMVVLAASAAFLILMATGRRGGTPTGLTLATLIALGIGLHNLGEGLAIGAAFAAGAAGLGTFLVLGFTIHNITEGIGIAAPMLKKRPSLWTFPALTLLAGGPAVLGLWIGSLANAPQWSALALAIGAGAILQVVIEVGAYLARSDGRGTAALLSWPVMSGLFFGVTFMYGTAMLVKV
ncbi:metal transporter [Mesorhizobium sp. J428]|uniref:metal transporter n=1 Tax=Mesorhizobium sp. J428 TaxID=2898440 RepID=UPI002151FA44|nr:metal transporter [Mesorhizobium sp. J428]MCR5857422.1 metal transporter [Mesorhizobium sp. J428]